MRILFVADLNVYAKGYARLRALNRIGVDVIAISHTAIGGEDKGYLDLSVASRLAWKLGIQSDSEGVNRQILSETKTLCPDLVWIEKGNMIKSRTLQQLKAECPYAVIAAYSEDDMFNSLNTTRSFISSLPFYDIVFTTKSHNASADELPALGAKRCVKVDKAFDPDQHYPIEINEDERRAYGGDIGFIGSYAPERGADMLFLAKQGFDVCVWGNGWDAFPDAHPNLSIGRRALVNTRSDLRYTKGIASMRINLGFLRKANRDVQTDRSVEIPACGGFMLAEYSTEHALLFKEGVEAVFYRNRTELVEKACYFLDNEEEREAIAKAGRRRCLESGYTHEERMRFMIFEAMGIQL